jgi:hypothetical protein
VAREIAATHTDTHRHTGTCGLKQPVLLALGLQLLTQLSTKLRSVKLITFIKDSATALSATQEILWILSVLKTDHHWILT